MQRVLKLNKATNRNGHCVLYVMSRDQRLEDNHALLAAQEDANKLKLPLVVLFNVLPKTGNRSREHFEFMLDGIQQIENKLHNLKIDFILTTGSAVEQIELQLSKHTPAAVYFDFSPLRNPRILQKKLADTAKIPCYVVDTHNIIPCWHLSDKQEFAAHTMRRKVFKNLEQWLIEPPALLVHTYTKEPTNNSTTWATIRKNVSNIEKCGIDVRFEAGETAAQNELQKFIKERLGNYAHGRNNPLEDYQSNLSAYLHFGQISSLRVALELTKLINVPPLLLREPRLPSTPDNPSLNDNIDALLEELIVRKELSDNFCFYNKNYDTIDGAPDWAKKSLSEHRDDRREFLYGTADWESAKTHDRAWNAAQNQMMRTGKMHGYMRMYWAKKILEWSESPNEAVRIAIYLNDKYSIDGGDPNGYTGVLWSIVGLHDRPWFERDVYGKIRYMNAGGLKRKFDIDGYIAAWS